MRKLVVDGHEVYDDTDIAPAFNDYFRSVAEKIDSDIP